MGFGQAGWKALADAPNVIATYQGVEIAGISVTPLADRLWSLETLPCRLRCCQTVFTAV